ncbi:MAG: DUF2309 family protein, partial [Proteobacteria bacterium]|nr:DUF2309 family protein [Pseudomonadota bacterium]
MPATALSHLPEHVALRTVTDKDQLTATIRSACRRIAPLWPLKHFVAVNPFLGFTQEPFAETCAKLSR